MASFLVTFSVPRRAQMLRLALSVAALLCLVIASASAQAPAVAATRAQSCEFEGEHIRHRGAKYLVGRPHKRGSIYGACENGRLTCFEDNGIADAPQPKHMEVPCDVREQRRKLGVAVRLKEDVWPGGLVWYRLNTTFSANERKMIKEAIAVYESTDVKISFKECEPASLCQNKYVSFEQNEDACYSYVGYVDDGLPQIANLGKSCFDGSGTVVHEIGHVLGLYHEHTHPQREVIILTDTDLPVSAANYAKETDAILKPYDRGSIMHYGRSAGLCLPKDEYPLKSFCDVEVTMNCVMPVRQHCNTTRSKEIGQRSVLSAGDLNTLKVLYGSTDGSNDNSKPVPIPNGPSSDDKDESSAAPAPVPSPTTARPTAAPSSAPTTAVPTTTLAPATAAPTPASVSPTLAPATSPPVTSPPAPSSARPTLTPTPTEEDTPVKTEKPTEAPTATPAASASKAPTPLTAAPQTDSPPASDNAAYPITTSAAPATTKKPHKTTRAPATPSYPYVPGDVHGEGHFAGPSNGIWWAVEWIKNAKKAILSDKSEGVAAEYSYPSVAFGKQTGWGGSNSKSSHNQRSHRASQHADSSKQSKTSYAYSGYNNGQSFRGAGQ